ncbi:unnamed protein product, partial [Ectocarpus sp. 12 AP-2014]
EAISTRQRRGSTSWGVSTPSLARRETFSVLEPSAGRAAGWCWGAFLAFLGAGVTLREVDATGWRICLGLMGLFLIGAGAATLVACRFKIRTAREENERRTIGIPTQGAPDNV